MSDQREVPIAEIMPNITMALDDTDMVMQAIIERGLGDIVDDDQEDQ